MKLTGIGLYTFPEAARLTRIPSAQLRRWLLGYKRGEGTSYPPLWNPDLAEADLEGLSFHDLLEARLVAHFRHLGISLQTIRLASQHARDLFDSAHPFICKQFLTDGKSIFAEALEHSDDKKLIDLKSRQYVIEKVVRQSLFAGMEFEDGQPRRWFPTQSKRVVLDPDVAFGKPTISDVGVRTDVLFDAWRAEGKDYRLVAGLYDVSRDAVKAAVRYEESLTA
ncbi:DUF433 domain-containing protein [Thioalkalivibrio sp. ALJ2]|uniref:DUF433 domain-containing protein n=1 Tax=Thioalkalivibrio sp. ALJ2 TaxID=1261622 RepID=UPI00037BCB3B|nr:DUF433 domain-containing protein [Thioalkalivibrio sp. ALJ2]